MEIPGAFFADLLFWLIVFPLHLLAWATGVLIVNVVTLGRYRIVPFGDDGSWAGADDRPILPKGVATLVGMVVWTIALAVIFWKAQLT